MCESLSIGIRCQCVQELSRIRRSHRIIYVRIIIVVTLYSVCTSFKSTLRVAKIQHGKQFSVATMHKHAKHIDDNNDTKMYSTRRDDNDNRTSKGNANHILFNQMTSSS